MAEVTTDEGALPQEKGLSEAGMDVQKQVQKNTLVSTSGDLPIRAELSPFSVTYRDGV